MTRYASVNDLQARFSGTIDPGQTSWAGTLLDDAYDVIVDQVPGIPDRLRTDADGTLLRRLIRVQCSMVVRVLQNPNGYLTETVDDYTYRRDSTVSTGQLYLAEDELDSLRVTRKRRTAFSVIPS